jgi:hypothetical protein
VLEIRPNCECCDLDLPGDSSKARICSFECTFCSDCAEGVLSGICPNCGGNLVERPIRSKELLQQFPASTRRVPGEGGCPQHE